MHLMLMKLPMLLLVCGAAVSAAPHQPLLRGQYERPFGHSHPSRQLSAVDPSPSLAAEMESLRNNTKTVNLIAAYKEVRDALTRQVVYEPGMLCLTSGVYGHVKKEATGRTGLPVRVWKLSAILRSTLGEFAKPGPDFLPVYRWPMVYISDKYKFIYLRTQKSSSSAMLLALTETFCGATGVCTPDELRSTGIPHNDAWKDYFVFTWVRNPWQRMASSYVFLLKFLREKVAGQEGPGPPCSIPFAAFVKDPFSIVTICEERGCCPWRFGHWDYALLPGHLSDQATLAFSYDGRSLVDYIGRTEHIEEDWATMMEIFNARNETPFHAVQIRRVNVALSMSGGSEHPEEACSSHNALLNETTVNLITQQFAMDVQRFKFALPANSTE